ncbi:MAG: hypothetical protein HXY41_17535, partial [Chloroflexi bacterium]|nr:hypothetical protein [Chloroflexota bacterium]
MMATWYFTPNSISFLVQAVLCVSIMAYMAYLTLRFWQRKTTVNSTLLLVGFFFGLTGFAISSFLNVSLNPFLRLYAVSLQMPMLALAVVFLLQFAYYFPSLSPRHRWESRITLGLSLVYMLSESLFGVYRLNLLAHQEVRWRPAVLDAALAACSAWLLIILFRQTIRLSNEHKLRRWYMALLHPCGRMAYAVRNFGLIFTCFMGLSVVEIALGTKWLPKEIRDVTLSLIPLVAIAAFTLTYLNALPETTSFMVRLISVTLVTVLAIIGVVGWLIAPAFLDRLSAEPLAQPPRSLRFSPNAQGGYDIQPVTVAYQADLGTPINVFPEDTYEIGLNFPFLFYGQSYDTLFINYNGTISMGEPLWVQQTLFYYGSVPGILSLLTYFETDPNNDASGVFIRHDPDKLVVTWHQ